LGAVGGGGSAISACACHHGPAGCRAGGAGAAAAQFFGRRSHPCLAAYPFAPPRFLCATASGGAAQQPPSPARQSLCSVCSRASACCAWVHTACARCRSPPQRSTCAHMPPHRTAPCHKRRCAAMPPMLLHIRRATRHAAAQAQPCAVVPPAARLQQPCPRRTTRPLMTSRSGRATLPARRPLRSRLRQACRTCCASPCRRWASGWPTPSCR
jgi:hypothetical protein